jgi:DNA-binding MarR family transcriptional regulator
MTLRTRTRPDEFDPLDWVLEHWQAQNRPAAEHFVAASSLFRTYQAVTARFDEVLSEFELTRTGYLLLVTLFLSGDRARPLSYLSRNLLVHPTTITLVVDQMEQRGLVERVPHETDRRSTLVHLTEAGHEVADRATEALAAAKFGLAVDLDTAIELVEVLRRVRREINDIPAVAPNGQRAE